MKTQCPRCKNVFVVPDEYEGRSISCTLCNNSFFANKYIPPSPPSPPSPPPPPLQKSQPNNLIQTIERTGKWWKAFMLAGGLGMFLSIVLICGGLPVEYGKWLISASVIALLYGKIGEWWYHG